MSAAICPVEGALFHEDRRTEMTRQIVTIHISNATEKMRRLMKMGLLNFLLTGKYYN